MIPRCAHQKTPSKTDFYRQTYPQKVRSGCFDLRELLADGVSYGFQLSRLRLELLQLGLAVQACNRVRELKQLDSRAPMSPGRWNGADSPRSLL